MLTSRDDPQFFEKGNIVKVNWTNKSKKQLTSENYSWFTQSI